MNTELVVMALQALRKHNEPSSQLRPPKLDAIGLVIPQVSLFLRDKKNPREESLAMKLLAETGREIVIAAPLGARYALTVQGICQISGKKRKQVPFREAINAFCSYHDKPPQEFVPFLESQIECLARQVLAPGSK